MPSTTSSFSEAPVGLMSGYWCPPVFQARPQKNPQFQSIAPSAVLPSRDSKETRKLKKKVTRRDSEPSLRKYLPLGFVRPLSWVKGKRSANEGASADATNQMSNKPPLDQRVPLALINAPLARNLFRTFTCKSIPLLFFNLNHVTYRPPFPLPPASSSLAVR